MAMLGNARMVIWFEVADPKVIPEHDHWHAHEHMYERLGIPGFLRGRRSITRSGPRRYFVTYEVETIETLHSPAYRRCLENPTPWTRRMMPLTRNITRSLCRIGGTFGSGVGAVIATLRFAPVPGGEDALRGWLVGTAMPGLPAKPGVVGVHLLEAVRQTGPKTSEQMLRGGMDGEADWVLLVDGYDADAVQRVLATELGREALERQGAAPGAVAETFFHDFALTAQDVGR